MKLRHSHPQSTITALVLELRILAVCHHQCAGDLSSEYGHSRHRGPFSGCEEEVCADVRDALEAIEEDDEEPEEGETT